MAADAGSVMAGSAGARNSTQVAEGGVVGIETGDVGNVERRVVEDALAASNAGLRSVGAIVPGVEESEHILVEGLALRVATEGVVDAGVVADTGKGRGTAGCAVGGE